MKAFINKYILLRHVHLQSRLMIYFSILSILPLYIIGSVTYQSAERTIEKNATEYTVSKLQQSISSLDLYIENGDSVLQSLFFDRNLRQYIYDSKRSDFDRTVAISEVFRILNAYVYPTQYIRQIYIVDQDDGIFASGTVMLKNLKDESWFNEFFQGTEKMAVIPTHNAGRYIVRLDNRYDSVITILRKYVNIEKNEQLGVIGIDLGYQYIHNIFDTSELNEFSTTLLVTPRGDIVYAKNKELVGTQMSLANYSAIFENQSGSYIEIIDKVPYFVVYTTSEKTGWKLIQTLPTKQLFAEAQTIKTKNFFVGLVCVFFALLFSIGISYGISAPLKKLRTEMSKVEKGDLNVHMAINSNDEIGELSKSFNQMVGELNASIEKIYEDENIKKQIELNMLQQQINPHFLFNTLDSINWMARMQNVPNISTTITSLVKLLQASTYTNRDFVTITEEIENVKNYIAIQKFRYGSLFDVDYQIEDDVKDKYTLKLILQPLVENAIYHGLEDKVDGGKITIGGKIDKDSIVLWVEDNGKGIEQALIDQLLTKEEKTQQSYNSIGISNTAKRLKLYYGNAFGLELNKVVEGGTKATITIPVRTEERIKLDDKSDDC